MNSSVTSTGPPAIRPPPLHNAFSATRQTIDCRCYRPSRPPRFNSETAVRHQSPRGAKVTVLDDLSTGSERNLEHHEGRVCLLKGDIRDEEACREAVTGARYVFHLAARGSVLRSLADPVSTIDINVRGTAAVFAACRGQKAPIVVFASSSSVYGDSTSLPKREGEEGKPLSPYALSKAVGEQLAETSWR